MKELHLICEAHLDPVWLWEWEEGASAAISTFQSAANLADEFDYIFCHNEVSLYKYIAEYAPDLFEKIKQLIKAGKWHVIGGWYLQPDANMPAGESFIRHAQVGHKYFAEHFGENPTTALNFDSFGHTRGLVQIIRKCGQDSYIFVRPFGGELDLPDDFFWWEGFDGSRIKAFRSPTYNSTYFGCAKGHCQGVKGGREDREIWMCLWGVGNHGGGPSRKDLADIKEWMESDDQCRIIHSTPEEFFKRAEPTADFDQSLRISMPGCYTSASELKRKHIALENSLYSTERALSAAALSGLVTYPEKDLADVTEDLLNCEFHDILPGSATKRGIENGLRIINHGLHIAEFSRAKAFFALSQNEPVAENGEYPILVFNFQPYEYETYVECEFNLAEQNHDISRQSKIRLFDGDKEIPCQIIREESNLLLDWRKRILFKAVLPALSVKRFKAFVEFEPAKQPPVTPETDIVFDNGRMQVVISKKTGLMTSYKVDGKEYLDGPAFEPYIYTDNEDPWGMADFQHVAMGSDPEALPLSACDKGVFRGRTNVKVVEDGELLLSVESFFEGERAGVRLLYNIYKKENKLDVKVNAIWNEQNRMLKLHIPTVFKNGNYIGQTSFGTEVLYDDGRENVSHRFVSAGDGEQNRLSIINNCIYGSSFSNGEIRLSLLRGARYSGHPIPETMPNIGPDRYVSIIDQGEHEFEFRMCVMNEDELDREATEFNLRPYALNVFPTGSGKGIATVKVNLSNPKITMSAFKKSETDEDCYIARFYNGSSRPASADFTLGEHTVHIDFGKYEVKTVTCKKDGMTVGDFMKI